MKLFFVLCTLAGMAALLHAQPRYHAVKIRENAGPLGLGNDGSIMASIGAGVGPSIYYQGSWQTMADQAGIAPGKLTWGLTLYSHDTWSANFASGGGISYYKGTARTLPQQSGPEQDAVIYTNGQGDYVGTSYTKNLKNNTVSHAWIVHNGVRTNIDDYPTDPYGDTAYSYPTWLSDTGYVSGDFSIFGVYALQAIGWIKKPGETPLGDLSINSYRVNNRGDIVGTGRDGGGVLIRTIEGKYLSPHDPDGSYISLRNPDMNNLGQVVFESRKYVTLYDNGKSYYLNSLLDNAEILPVTTLWEHPYINDSGQIIAGISNSATNTLDLYRFDPVPEPSSIAALGLGLILTSRRRAIPAVR